MNAIEGQNESDVALARACLAGDVAAIARFDATILAPMVAEIARVYRDADASELEQVVREKVLVGKTAGGPKLASYSGRAPLAAWVRVVAVRAAISMLRRVKRAEPLDDDSDEALGGALGNEVEIAHLRSEHQGPFKDAFHRAIAALSDQDRVVLRLHVLDDLSIDEIGRIYGVHRATAARWLVRVREELHRGTRRELARSLDLGETEFASLAGVLLSRLDMSVERVLGDLEDASSAERGIDDPP